MFTAKNILVPVDFTPESKYAVDWAVRIAQGEPGAVIHLCHALTRMLAPIGPETVAFEYEFILDKEKERAEKGLRTLQTRILESIPSTLEILEGFLPYALEGYWNRVKPDLIIMTTHGRQGFSHFLHGSDTEDVIRVAPCPVLVLHLNQGAALSAASNG